MGLDITAYERAVEADPATCDKDSAGIWCENESHKRAMVYEGFERSARGLKLDQDQGEYFGLSVGPCYEVGSWSEAFWFRAGSYSGYTRFRDNLAKAALGVPAVEVFNAPGAYEDQPFFELINFADNEGTIGPEAAADLEKDFVELGEKVLPQLDEYDQESYHNWLKAFRLAAHTGLVDFH